MVRLKFSYEGGLLIYDVDFNSLMVRLKYQETKTDNDNS